MTAFSQNTPSFGIGTRWIYERIDMNYLITYETVEIICDTIINDTLAFVIEKGAFGRPVTHLRCFETLDASFNFVGYPCDSTWVITSTTDILPPATAVYPNPNDGQVFVDGVLGQKVRYALYDIAGRCEQQGVLQNEQLYIAHPGVYFLLLEVAGIWSSHKVVVVH